MAPGCFIMGDSTASDFCNSHCELSFLVFGLSHSTSKPPLLRRYGWRNNQASCKCGLSGSVNSTGRRLNRQDGELWNDGTTKQKIIRNVHKLCFLLVMYSCYFLSDLRTAYFLHRLNTMILSLPDICFILLLYFTMRFYILILCLQSAAHFPMDNW